MTQSDVSSHNISCVQHYIGSFVQDTQEIVRTTEVTHDASTNRMFIALNSQNYPHLARHMSPWFENKIKQKLLFALSILPAVVVDFGRLEFG